MKAKMGYSGLSVFSPVISTEKESPLKLSGRDEKVQRINELFDGGDADAARRVLREALDEVARQLDSTFVENSLQTKGIGKGDEAEQIRSLRLKCET